MKKTAAHRHASTPSRAAGRGLLAAALAASLVGCKFDSWMDPSVVGRWEDTPAVAPILDRLDVIETPEEDYISTSEVRAEDLIPQRLEYQVGAGDLLTIEIFELFAPNTPYQATRVVDQTGQIGLPAIGRLEVAGLTETEIQRAIANAAIDADIFSPEDPPEVSVIAESKRQNSFTIMGLVRTPNRYSIPEADFRLLDALAVAGANIEQLDQLYVIRQAPLDESVVTGHGAPTRRGPQEPGRGDTIEDLLRETTPEVDGEPGDEGLDDLIDELLEMDPESDPTDAPPPSPLLSVVSSQPESDAAEPVLEIPAPVESDREGDRARWIYLNGEWVRVATRDNATAEIPPVDDLLAGGPELSNLVTQRVIAIPAKPLRKGDARYNIVIRPDDVIRIPAPQTGVFYVEGQVNRPGTYELPNFGRMTLRRAITSAGGLGPLAIPERVEITRTIAGDRQITVLLNLKAIYDATAPDVYIKPEDQINVGTTWYAAPLAVIRNGFRASYGFGFLLDRNFGNDVFGAPPTNRFGN
ncbi:MAG: polysaccharide biosynthesis/export family protein [Phycisphaerales bacterium]